MRFKDRIVASAEDRFLLTSLGSRYDPALVDATHDALAQPLDWYRIIRQADRHGVIPLLWQQLHAIAPREIPAEVGQHLRASSGFILRRNLGLAGELVSVLNAIEEAGVRAAPFKGPVLAVSAYRNLGLRGFADLDILIQLPDLDRAVAVLRARGYEPVVPVDTQYLASECQLRLCASGEKIVELHWRLMEKSFSCPIDVTGLWLRMTSVELAGKKLLTLGHEDLFLYLCLHGVKHRWERLEWVCAIAELMKRSSTDWDEVHARARSLGCVRALSLGVWLANELLNAPVPAEYTTTLASDTAVSHLAAGVCRSMFAESTPGASPAQRAAHYSFLIRSRERLIDKARIALYSCARTPHPNSKELFVLPPPLRFLYYVMRPFDWLAPVPRSPGVGA